MVVVFYQGEREEYFWRGVTRCRIFVAPVKSDFRRTDNTLHESLKLSSIFHNLGAIVLFIYFKIRRLFQLYRKSEKIILKIIHKIKER